jgi:hypothetical protein
MQRTAVGSGILKEHLGVSVLGVHLAAGNCKFLTLDFLRDEVEFGFTRSYAGQTRKHMHQTKMTLKNGVPSITLKKGRVQWDAVVDSGSVFGVQLDQTVATVLGYKNGGWQVGGDYLITGLDAGAWRIGFFPTLESGYSFEYYDNKRSDPGYNPVTVTDGAVSTGINATLETGSSLTGTITDAEKAYLQAQPLDGRMKNNQFGMLTTAYEVTLEEPLNLPRGSVIAPADAVGNGFLVEGCDFGFNRSRGAIIKAGQGRIVRNRFTENWMEAVILAPEFWWLEAGCGDDITVEGNTITRCHDTAIRVAAFLHSDRPLPAGAHKRITIKGNAIKDCPAPQIHVTSTDGLTVRGNTVAGGDAPAKPEKTLLLDSCTTFDVQKDFRIPIPAGVGLETGIENAHPDGERPQ